MTEPSPQQSIERALQRLLRPLIRLLLRHGVSFGTFAELAKRIFVEVAQTEFALADRKQTDSRVATITGLTRKDVARIKKLLGTTAEAGQVARHHRAARVIHGWVHDSRFRDTNGQPLALSFDGAEPTFSSLVKDYSGDMPPRAILDELLRVGVVEKDGDGTLKLLGRAYIPRASQSEKLRILGQDVAGLIATIDHNLHEQTGPARFQRKIYYDNLPEEAIPLIQAMLAERGQTFLEMVDEFMAEYDRDANPAATGTGRKAAGIGLYYFDEEAAPQQEKKS